MTPWFGLSAMGGLVALGGMVSLGRPQPPPQPTLPRPLNLNTYIAHDPSSRRVVLKFSRSSTFHLRGLTKNQQVGARHLQFDPATGMSKAR